MMMKLETRMYGPRGGKRGRALEVGARSYRHVASILQHGLDRAPALDVEPRGPSLTHENVRGRQYYH